MSGALKLGAVPASGVLAYVTDRAEHDYGFRIGVQTCRISLGIRMIH